MRYAGAPQASQATRHVVRVQLDGSQGKDNGEILTTIKRSIPSAVAVRTLQSGDIDVTVPTEAAKDKAYSTPPMDGLKVHRRDYLVEVPGVPLSLRVACEKGADNSLLANNICEASRSMAPGLQITRIRWLHTLKDHRSQPKEPNSKAKTRGSLILGFPTCAIN
jgi:hypothetical protein